MPTATVPNRDLVVLGSVLVVGAIGALLDTTIVAIAIDDLSDAFSRSVAATQWVTTAYLLAMGVVIPLMGWLTDRLGARRLWLTCLAVFLGGSVLCSAAWSLETLVVARVIQGLGGGLMLPLVQAILTRAAGPQRIGRVIGAVGIPGQLAPILGPVLGGLILGRWGWHWLFLINVPVCAAAILLAWRVLPDDRPQGAKARADLVGAALSVPSCCAILWGLSSFETGSRVAPVAAMLAGAVLSAGFVVHARHRRERALVDVRLLGERIFATGAAMTFLFGAGLYGATILLPLFYRHVRDLPVSEVGLLLAPQGLGTMAALWIAGRAADRHGPRVVGILGAAASLAALVAFAAIGADAPVALLGCALVLLGGGLATMGVAATAGAYRRLTPGAIPRATSLINIVQRLGAGFGAVTVGLTLTSLQEASPPLTQSAAFSGTFWSIAVLTVPAVAVAWLLPKGPAGVPGPPTRPDLQTKGTHDAHGRR